jgi:hypothetical protein
MLTSSTASVCIKAAPEGHCFTEDDWSDAGTLAHGRGPSKLGWHPHELVPPAPADMLREKKIFYPLSKTLAERAAWDWAEKARGLLLRRASTRKLGFTGWAGRACTIRSRSAWWF